MYLLINPDGQLAAFHELEGCFQLADFPVGWQVIDYQGGFPIHPATGTVEGPLHYLWNGTTVQPDLSYDVDEVLKADIDGERFASDAVLVRFARIMLAEINTLRAGAGLQDRTRAQLKTAMKQ